MTDRPPQPAKKTSEPSRRWPAILSMPASRSEMTPDVRTGSRPNGTPGADSIRPT